MTTDEKLIEKARTLIESIIGWGDSRDWTNQDFLALSEQIREKTGISLSHVTLKRIWGKVRYESLPNTHTLNTLAQFAGYENWRDFKIAQTTGTPQPSDPPQPAVPHPSPLRSIHRSRKLRLLAGAGLTLLVLACLSFFMLARKKPARPFHYAFSSKKVVSQGVPNSVIFDYDASGSQYDSVIIQQSWDTNLRTRVPIDEHQHTSIYYYPDFYYAKLIAGGRIVKEHELFIQSDGWLPIIEHSPVPVYFTKKETIANGHMSLSATQIESRNIHLQPAPPTILFTNVRDFGEIYSDDFVFETALKNDYREGAAACQLSRVYLLCQGTGIWVPLCAKGCVSNIDMLFTSFYTSGKREDLSAFGVDFNDYVKLRIESHAGKAQIFVNDRLAYQVNGQISRSKIIGIDFRFQGTGSVDYVRLSNSHAHYEDEF